MTDESWPWIAQYLVMKRASIEPNFHTLYAQFIDHLKKQEFPNMVLRETYRNIKVRAREIKLRREEKRESAIFLGGRLSILHTFVWR